MATGWRADRDVRLRSAAIGLPVPVERLVCEASVGDGGGGVGGHVVVVGGLRRVGGGRGGGHSD